MNESREQAVVFTCDGDQLLGILHRAREQARTGRAGVLVVVGGPQYRVGSHRQFTLMARVLAEAGVPVMRFDYRGLGDSEGAARTFESIGDDIRAAIDAFIQAVPGLESVVLWGLCDAASAILMNAAQDPRVAGLVLVNPESRSADTEAQAYLRHYYVGRLLQKSFWRKFASGDVNIAASVRSLLATVRDAGAGSRRAAPVQQTSYVERMLTGFRAFQGPVLLLLSGRDLTANAFESLAGKSPAWKRVLGAERVKLVRLPNADHTFSSRASLEEGTAAVLVWMRESFT